MITAHTAACSAMRRALEEAWEALGRALYEDADDIHLSILMANIKELERMVRVIEGP